MACRWVQRRDSRETERQYLWNRDDHSGSSIAQSSKLIEPDPEETDPEISFREIPVPTSGTGCGRCPELREKDS